MTKSLTEQWKDGTLTEGDYYILTTGLKIKDPIISYYEKELSQFDGLCNCSIKEVLAPVPSYDEYKELKEERDYFQKTMFERNANINELQERIKEAEYILDEMGWADRGLIDDYFEKWGRK